MKRYSLLAAVITLLASAAPADAGEMAFKINRLICPLDTPAPKGWNMVSLPWESPYTDAEDICKVFSLVPSKGTVLQLDPPTGRMLSHSCGDLGAYHLLPRLAVRVTNPVMTSGVLVGSFPDLPAPGVHLYPRAFPAPTGMNWLSWPYHTTAEYMSDVCDQMGPTSIIGPAKLREIDACTGRQWIHNCGDLAAVPLLFGEALAIDVMAPIDFVPRHL